MDNTEGFIDFKKPTYYELLEEYSNSDRSSYALIRQNKKDREKIKQALNGSIESSQLGSEAGYKNKGYIEALGLQVQPEE